MLEFGERGRQYQKNKSLEYWSIIEARVPATIKAKIIATTVVLQSRVERRLLGERGAKDYIHYLYRIAAIVGNLDDAQAVSAVLTKPEWEGQLEHTVPAWNWYREVNNIKEKLSVKVDRRRPLPILTPENTLQATLTVPKQLYWMAYFRLRYETGPRPCEPFLMQKQDINFDRQLVRYTSAKGSGETLERELPISPLCAELLRTLTTRKQPEEYVFTKPFVPNKPFDYKDAELIMRKVRGQLKQAGYNVHGLTLYVYRHAFATRLYQATKDLLLVQRSLGHRRIEDTMIYIHLQPDQVRRFDVVRLEISDKEGVTKQIAEGWELAVQTPEEIYFKRPRWVP